MAKKNVNEMMSNSRGIPLGKVIGLGVVGFFILVVGLGTLQLATVDGDEEAVFIKKPWIFGSGGVEDVALVEGSEWSVFTTDFIKFKNTPVKYSEDFDDVMSDDNTPVDLQAYLTLQIERGKSPVLYKNYGVDWYVNNIREVYREAVRNRISTYKMYDLTSNREIYDTIKIEVEGTLQTHFNKLSAIKEFPIKIMNVVVDRAVPNKGLKEEMDKTAMQIQAKRTQEAQKEMEDMRRLTEAARAKADRAYMLEMNLTADQFIMLRSLEMEMEKVEMVRNKQNVNVDVMFGNSNLVWDIKKK